MDRAEQAISDTSILLRLGELFQLSKIVPHKDAENSLCSGVRRVSKSGSGEVANRGGGTYGGSSCCCSSDEDMTLAGYIE